eukprot:6181739-Pleurochrysis_carterae.AAC.1
MRLVMPGQEAARSIPNPRLDQQAQPNRIQLPVWYAFLATSEPGSSVRRAGPSLLHSVRFEDHRDVPAPDGSRELASCFNAWRNAGASSPAMSRTLCRNSCRFSRT